jgi:MoaA/NifB/PqqE/SkfB family radical SAM enzyme
MKPPADTRLDRLLRWQRGDTPGPWTITLFPTNRCNLRCKICWQRGAEGLEKTDETSDDRLLTLVDECAELGVREWCIIGGGEPLIRGEVVMEMCARIRGHGMNGTLQTNGTLLTAEYIKHLVEIGWSRVNVSLDGPDQLVNDDIRSAGSFRKATENMNRLREMKLKMKRAEPVMSIYAVLTSTNCDKIDRIVELAHELGCDDGGVQLTTMVVHSPMAKPFALTDEQKANISGHLLRAAERAAQYGMFNNFDLYLQEEILADPNAMHRAGTTPAGEDMAAAVCYEPWLSVAITAEGKVGPCCAFWDPRAESIQTMSFRGAWLGPYLTEIRQRLLEHRLPGYCMRCPSILFARSQTLRTQLIWAQMHWLGKLSVLSARSLQHLRRHGIRWTLRRGFEWAKIKLC